MHKREPNDFHLKTLVQFRGQKLMELFLYLTHSLDGGEVFCNNKYYDIRYVGVIAYINQIFHQLANQILEQQTRHQAVARKFGNMELVYF